MNREWQGGDSHWFLLDFSWELKLLLLNVFLNVILFECNSIFLLYLVRKISSGHDLMYIKDRGFCKRIL
jgi:hypothetical protein